MRPATRAAGLQRRRYPSSVWNACRLPAQVSPSVSTRNPSTFRRRCAAYANGSDRSVPPPDGCHAAISRRFVRAVIREFLAHARDGGDRPVSRRGQGDDQLRAGEAGHRDRTPLQASVLQRHRHAR